MQSNEDIQRLSLIDADLLGTRIERLYESRQRGDFKTFATYFPPYMTFELMVPRGLMPFHGRQEGLDHFLRFIRFNHMTYEWIDYQVEHTETFGREVAVRRKCLGRNRGTALVQELQICSILRFREGLIDQYIEYVDTASLMKLLEG